MKKSPADAPVLRPGTGASMLLLSMRGLSDLVAFALQYELEDVFVEVTGADRVDAGGRGALERSRQAYKLVRRLTGARGLARALAPHPSVVRLERDYELFFPVFNHAYELHALATVPDWRSRCRKAACFVGEVYFHQLPAYLLETLFEFDHVFVGVNGPMEEVERIVGRPVSYLPLAVDVVRFAPYPQPPLRTIDVLNVGRRSSVTHAALVELARARRIFYYYDTVAASGAFSKQRTFRVDAPAEHRLLYSSLLQRSRYSIANRALVTNPELTRGRQVMSSRFYEGAAAGAVMLGEAPQAEEFRRQFDWPDSVIPLPFDSPDVGRVLAELDSDPASLDRVRRDNVRNAALRHDWVHRIRVVLETLGLAPTPAMLAREQALRAIADANAPL
jgi:hypothetical protein